MFDFLTKLFGSRNERILKQMYPVVEQINAMESRMQLLSDDELKAKTAEFKARLADGETVDALLPEAFAVAREASVRCLGMRHFDVQLIGGMILNNGMISEMKTGEGKTLMATLPVYLNALTGRGVHVVTVNDYLAKRDAEWMGRLYAFLGLSTGVIVHGISSEERKNAYASDITYGTNNEFGFDYLRDNMAFAREDLVQREQHYAIVDEVDSILIDEARTPLIISGPAEKAGDLYMKADAIIKQLDAADYEKDEKDKAVSLTEEGMEHVETLLREGGLMPTGNLYDPENVNLMHAITQCLRANTLFTREVDYIVRNDEVIIIDEFTGRMMPGRRYSDGQHQALEAKEGVTVQPENQTLASVTFQNYFRMYEKLAGMTGTAETEAEEFHRIYGLEVVVVPTQKPMIRKNQPDLVYKNTEAKFEAAVEEIIEKHQKGQPVLVGTVSIAKNEIMSELLERKGVPHQILNAKHHEKEALILSQAGQIGMVTVATNMAGRGVDIELGGKSPDKDSAEYSDWEREHQQVVALGGLCVLGTERHEARRIDNQLRGRAGRQGDPGISRFYVALDDDLMRLFGGDQIKSLMTALKIPDDIPIENKMVSRSIESAQKRVEGHNFDIRKHLVEYDDVLNKQREIIYRFRRQALEGVAPEKGEIPGETLSQKIQAKIEEQIKTLMSLNSGDGQTDSEKIISDFATIIPFDEKSQLSLKNEIAQLANSTAVEEKLGEIARNIYLMREKEMGEKTIRDVEKFVTLSTVDNLWQAHLDNIDDLREGIGLRGYGQRDPLVEYKNEAFRLFEDLMGEIDDQIVRRIYKVGVPQRQERPAQIALKHQNEEVGPVRAAVVGKEVSGAERAEATRIGRIPVKRGKKIGRNDPCWCGSGKKWKHCHYPERG